MLLEQGTTNDILKTHKILQSKSVYPVLLLPFFYMQNEELLLNLVSSLVKNNITSLNNIDNIFLKQNESGNILMEDLSMVKNFCQKTSFYSEYKIIFVEGVDELSKNVANAMLKILEEVTSGTFFLLFYKSKKNILPTILSRSILIEYKNTKNNFNYLCNLIDAKYIALGDLLKNDTSLFYLVNDESLQIIEDAVILMEQFSLARYKMFFAKFYKYKFFINIMFLFIENYILTNKQIFNLSLLKYKKNILHYNNNGEYIIYYILYKLCK